MPGISADTEKTVSSEIREDDILTDKEMRDLQKANIVKALKRSNWKVSGTGGAAELLGVKPTTLADRIRTYRISRPTK